MLPESHLKQHGYGSVNFTICVRSSVLVLVSIRAAVNRASQLLVPELFFMAKEREATSYPGWYTLLAMTATSPINQIMFATGLFVFLLWFHWCSRLLMLLYLGYIFIDKSPQNGGWKWSIPIFRWSI